MAFRPRKSSTDGANSFLRAARAGNLEKVLEYLKGSIDINVSNVNGLNALHLASKEGHPHVVSELLKRGAKVNASTNKGNTALHIAYLAGQEEVVKILLQHGSDVNVQSLSGFTPLYMAAQENHESVVRLLLANGANQSLATEDGFTPLAVALQQGHDRIVSILLENDAKGKVRLPALHIAAKKDDCKAAALLLQADNNPDVTSKSLFTPLHIAAHYGNENIAQLLLDRGADVNFPAKHNITPLHVASKWGKANMVSLLLNRNARIDAQTRDGLTALHCAARSGHEGVVDLLLQRGAPVSAKTKNGLSPLHMSAQGDHVECARTLLHAKAPVDDVTVDYLTPLHVAAHCGHVRVAKLLLDRKADPNARALNGFTPLHIACKKSRIKVVELLLKYGASIEATTESGLTPLHVAAFMGCMNIVIYLIQHGASPDVPTVRGETPLHLAARANQADIIRILLRNGADVNAKAREQQTALHIASRLGYVDIIGIRLQHKAVVDSVTKDSYTALHIAAKEGQEEVASLLIDHGAKLTATTKKGFTPLHLAAKYGNIKVARLLLAKEAPVNAQGKNGVTPLHVAAHYDHVNVALLLLEKGASPHAAAKNGYTALHIAAKKNQMDIATSLLKFGAKATAESKAGFTPLHLAAQEGHVEMARLLLHHQAQVDARAKNGLTPLHLCSQEDRVNVADVLVKGKANVDAQTKAGYTPLHVASHFGHGNMVRFLINHGADVNSVTTHGYTPLMQAAQQGHTQVVQQLLDKKASPNVVTNQGQTALSIAQKLGYISVVETLKVVTETVTTTTTTTVTEEKYKVVVPETMHETFMSDSEDEAGEEHMLADQSDYRYLTVDEMKSLGDDSAPMDVTRDEYGHTSRPDLTEHRPDSADLVSEAVGVEKFIPDNIEIKRPVCGKLKWRTFLVSFLVDARGGAMRGCRHSGIRVIIPPLKASMPTRITCRYVRKEKLACPPPLAEGESLASRILEVGPTGAKFLGQVMIEVPHFASLRGKEREIIVLRSENGETWREHVTDTPPDVIQQILKSSFEGDNDPGSDPDFNPERITRIVTTDFPHYFAIVTRIRQEIHAIGPEGGIINSTVVPQVQAIFPEGALTKKIKVGLQAHPINSELVSKLLGNRVAVSPIVTVEPRRRKFHKPITLSIPLSMAATKGMINSYAGDAPTLRLLCSITGGLTKAQWEDVTGSTPLSFVNNCVSFTTTVSARFWLIDCRQINEAARFANDIYRESILVPFMAKFVVFAKRHEPNEAQLRVFCMTDDREDKTLESQERFEEIAKSRDVEVLEGRPHFVEFAGNLTPITKSGEQLNLTFHAFRENRLPFLVRVRDGNQEPTGRIAFMRDSKRSKMDPPQTPICNLNLTLPGVINPSQESRKSTPSPFRKSFPSIKETESDLNLKEISREVGADWEPLAQELDISVKDIAKFGSERGAESQCLSMLRSWHARLHPNRSAKPVLEKALKAVGRDDLVKRLLHFSKTRDSLERVVDGGDQKAFDILREELGSRGTSVTRTSVGRDIQLAPLEDKDILKDPESFEESEGDSGRDRDKRDIVSPSDSVVIRDHIVNPPDENAETQVRVTETIEHSVNGVKHTITQQTRTTFLVESDEPLEIHVQHQIEQRPTLETETWLSGEQDTSQVSVSSLPEDEKSEPTTEATASSPTTTSGEFNLSTQVVSNISEDSPKGRVVTEPTGASKENGKSSRVSKTSSIQETPAADKMQSSSVVSRQESDDEKKVASGTKVSEYEVSRQAPMIHRENEKKDDDQQQQETLSISDEDLREVEEESSEGAETRSEFKSREDDEMKTKKSSEVSKAKLCSVTEEETVEWEQIQPTPETVRPVMFKRATESLESEDVSAVGTTRDLGQDIVGKVIEEAKVRSRETSPSHYPSTSSSRMEVSNETISLAREIVDNVIDEVKKKLAMTEGAHPDRLQLISRQRDQQQPRPHCSGDDVKIVHTDCASPADPRLRDAHSSDREKESGSGSDGVYHSCASSVRSPSSRPTSGEVDINLWPGHGSSEYETCVTSMGSSSTTFASALTSQDTSYATARSSLSHTSSSRASTLEPDSEHESSGHLAELSSEGSETLVAGDEREVTPTIQELEEEVVPDFPPHDVIRASFEGSGVASDFMGPSFTDPSLMRGTVEEEVSTSEGTWHSSSVQTIRGDQSASTSGRVEGTRQPQQQQQQQQVESLVSPVSQEGSVVSVDQKSLKSQSSVSGNRDDCLHLQLYKDSRDRWKNGPTKASLALERPLAMESAFTLDKESHTLAILCFEVDVLLAFESRERLIQWQVHIRKHLPDTEQFLVQVTHSPGKSRVTNGPARLHLQNKSFSLVTGVPPKVVGHWHIQHLRKFGPIANNGSNGRFCFEGGSLCGKGEGQYILQTNQCIELASQFETAAAGKLILNRRTSKKRTDGSTACSCWMSSQVTNCHTTCGSDSHFSDGSSCDAFSDILRITDRTDLIDDDSQSTSTQLRWSSSSTSENGTTYLSCSTSLDGDACNHTFLQNYDLPRNQTSSSNVRLTTTNEKGENDPNYTTLNVPSSLVLPKEFEDRHNHSFTKLPSSSSMCSSHALSSGPSISTSIVDVDIKTIEKHSVDETCHYSVPRKVVGKNCKKDVCNKNCTSRNVTKNILSNSGEFYDSPRNVKANN